MWHFPSQLGDLILLRRAEEVPVGEDPLSSPKFLSLHPGRGQIPSYGAIFPLKSGYSRGFWRKEELGTLGCIPRASFFDFDIEIGEIKERPTSINSRGQRGRGRSREREGRKEEREIKGHINTLETVIVNK